MHRFNRKLLAANGKSSSSGGRESQRRNVWVVILSMVMVTTVSSIFALFYFGQGSQLLEAFKVENIQQLEMGNNEHHSARLTSPKSNSSMPIKLPATSEILLVTETAKNNLRTSTDENLASKEKEESFSHSNIKAKVNIDITTNLKSVPVASVPLTLVSSNKPVTSDVRGNLGPATVVTNEKVEDWLQDRWQAARNMQGEPIPGEHWIEVDLQEVFSIEKIVIDWEQAFSNQWSIMVRSEVDSPWKRLCVSKEAKTTEKTKMHVIQEVVPSKNRNVADTVRFAKLTIHRPSTMWGSSIWRFQIWGRPHTSE